MTSRYLFAEASLFEGIGRIFDWADTLTEFNRSVTDEQADFFAMRSDWQAAGDDIRLAMKSAAGDSKLKGK